MTQWEQIKNDPVRHEKVKKRSRDLYHATYKHSERHKNRRRPVHNHEWYVVHKETALKQNTNHRKRNRERSLLNNIRSRARTNGLPFDLTLKDIVVPTTCPVLGVPLVWTVGKGPKPDSPSVDRVIPILGYVKNNIRIISHRANRIKTDATTKELELVLQYLKEQAP